MYPLLYFQTPPCQAITTGLCVFSLAGLAASANVIGVSLGGILGHCMCTGGAVLGGRQLAAYVAEKTLAVSTVIRAQRHSIACNLFEHALLTSTATCNGSTCSDATFAQ